jgi:hypothetical protein
MKLENDVVFSTLEKLGVVALISPSIKALTVAILFILYAQ